MSRTSRTPGLSAFSLPPTSSPTPHPPSPSTSSPSSQQPNTRLPLPPSTRASLYAHHGTTLLATQRTSLATQLSVFRALLHNFALLHSDKIRADAAFRGEFVRMCRAVGVDPSARDADGAGKGGGTGGGPGAGWLSKGLGGLLGREGEGARERGVEVAVRVVEVCRSRRGVDGGLTAVDVVRAGVARGHPSVIGGEMPSVTEQEIYAAVGLLAPLGSGFSVVQVGTEHMVRSVARGLSEDQGRVMGVVQVLGWVTCGLLEDNLGWNAARAETVCTDLVGEGVVWVDDQGERRGEREFWGTGGLGGWEE